MANSLHVYLWVAAATAATAASQDSRPTPSYLPIPSEGPCASVVEPADDGDHLVGTFALATDRDPVVDGDTIIVDGIEESLRLICIDTEELFRNPEDRAAAEEDWYDYLVAQYRGSTPGQPPTFGTPMGEAAKAFAQWFFAEHESVRLEYDNPRRKHGYYGRRLVHVLVEVDGRWVNYNIEAVRQGFSPYYTKYGRSNRYHDAFEAAQNEARSARRGIWVPDGEPPAYPDYGTRLHWWGQRDRAIQTVEAHRAEYDLVILGDDGAWEELVAREGEETNVIGTVSRVREDGDKVFFHLAHRHRQDLLIVGNAEQAAGHPMRDFLGHYVRAIGVVELYEGSPQLDLGDLQVHRIDG